MSTRRASPGSRGTLGQRVRARLIAGLARVVAALPERPVDALADALGELWYRVAPERASLGRRNLERVVRALAARGLGGRRVASAAVDGAALERMLRATFRQTVRYYLDMARLPSQDPAEVDERLHVETPEAVARAFGPDKPPILVAMHFGAVEYPAIFAVAQSGSPIVTPMETLDDPPLQDWVRRTRGTVGVEIVGLRNARRALFDALAAGKPVGLVADRHVAGGSVDVPFFGATAPLPPGPAFLAVETGRPIYLGAVRRLGRGRYGGRLSFVPTATDGDRRARIAATAATIASAMEAEIAVAPEQWWSLLSPIWPDIDARATAGSGRLEAAEPEPASPELESPEPAAGMTDRLGRADLHIHTLASDGTAGIVDILDHVERVGELDVIAIADHERIDAALVGRSMARDRGLPFEVVVGEEITTLGGHLLGLWLERRVKPFRSLRATIADIHDQGGIAIPAHPLTPYPLCAQGFVLRRLLADEPRFRPDAIEAFNPTTLGRPWHARVVRFAEETGLAQVGSSDAHALAAIGMGWTSFPGRTAEELRTAIAAGTTHQHGSFHATAAQLGTFRDQLRKYGRDARAGIGGKLRGDGTGRDLGYPPEHEAAVAARAALASPGPGTGPEARR